MKRRRAKSNTINQVENIKKKKKQNKNFMANQNVGNLFNKVGGVPGSEVSVDTWPCNAPQRKTNKGKQ